jgi:uncharacterized protein (UPF0335 family)
VTLRELRDKLDAIRARIRRNTPRSGDPERFHVEKSEIAKDLTDVIEELRKIG